MLRRWNLMNLAHNRRFGALRVRVIGNYVRFTKGFRLISIEKEQIGNVSYEKRVFKRHTLVVHTPYQNISFGFMTKRQVVRAIEFLNSLK